MLEHHLRALDAFVATVSADPALLAVVLAGSVGRGTERADSDLDVYLVVDEADYASRRDVEQLSLFQFCDYPGGYVDGKYVSLDLLQKAADYGSEPMRASFLGSRVVHARQGVDLVRLHDVIARIPEYPSSNRAENMRDFYALFAIHASYFGPNAVKANHPFMIPHAATTAAFYAGRALLAYNSILFPCAKQLLQALDLCTDLPHRFVEATEGLLTSPTETRFLDYLARVTSFTDWGVAPEQVLTRYMELDEWAWVTGSADPARR